MDIRRLCVFVLSFGHYRLEFAAKSKTNQTRTNHLIRLEIVVTINLLSSLLVFVPGSFSSAP